MTWARAVAVGIAVLFVAVTAALWGQAPAALVVAQAALVVLGLRGAWLLGSDPALAFWLLLIAALGTPLYLILAVPAGLAWRRSARRPATPRAPAR